MSIGLKSTSPINREWIHKSVFRGAFDGTTLTLVSLLETTEVNFADPSWEAVVRRIPGRDGCLYLKETFMSRWAHDLKFLVADIRCRRLFNLCYCCL